MKIHLAIAALLVALGSGSAAAESLAPNVHLAAYSAKPAQAVSVTGTGFAPNEPVDVSLGDQSLLTILTGLDEQTRAPRRPVPPTPPPTP